MKIKLKGVIKKHPKSTAKFPLFLSYFLDKKGNAVYHGIGSSHAKAMNRSMERYINDHYSMV